jgi:RimJ/RimL family protein N-acetyltransferase
VPVTPEHRERLRRGFAEASPETRYRRFLTPLSRLTDTQLEYLTHVDFVDHVAWGVETAEDQHGIGIGRWVRTHDDPDAAEAAVAVLDAYQGRGVGRGLLRLLTEQAILHGIRRFKAEVLAENEPMLRLLEDLGAEVRSRNGAVLELEVPLPESIDELNRSPLPHILRAAATGGLEGQIGRAS